jgi:hypothetical protein
MLISARSTSFLLAGESFFVANFKRYEARRRANPALCLWLVEREKFTGACAGQLTLL